MDLKDSLLIDDSSRNKIINDIDKNFFVVANAGSGKTSILVNRMVAMVEAGKDISKICAITFTKAAATEFLDRFQQKLRERENVPDTYVAKYPGDLGSSSPAKRDRCKNALKNINQCFLGTIDAFCNQVLSEFPLDAQIPSSSSVITEEEEMQAYLKEYTAISRNSTSSIYPLFKNFNTLNRNAEKIFSSAIRDVINASSLKVQFTDPTKPFTDMFNDIKARYEATIIDDIDELLSCEPDVVAEPKFINAFANFKKNASRLKASWTEYNFVNLIDDIYKLVKELRFNSNTKTSIILFQSMKSGKAYYFEPNGNPFDDLLIEINNIKYYYSIEFLLTVSQLVRIKLKNEGKLTFNEYLLTFREMLINDMKNDMNIIKHIRSKYSYFLIDESQDTSPFQTELFLLLTSKVKALKKEDCKPIPGSLFILGDPKQSIYRFRGADVPSYLNTKDLFDKVFDKSENDVLLMTKNFRSTDLLINYFNDVFGDMDNYYPIPVIANTNGTSGLYKYSNYVDVIKEMIDNVKYKVEVKVGDKTETRAPKFKDFLIITKSKKNAHDPIIKTLKENNIPCYVEGEFSISDTDAIKAIHAIFNYIVNRYNSYSGALYDLLASPIFNMKYEQVIGMKKDALPKEEKEYFEKIEELSEIDNPIILFNKILTSIELFKHVDFSNMEYAYFVYEALKDAYNSMRVSSNLDALKFIEDFISKKQERAMTMDFKPNAVKIANLHKVKGLEAPIVILVKAGTGNPNLTIRNDYLNNESYIIQTGGVEGNYGTNYTIKTDAFPTEAELEKNEANAENERLRYVAATRARSYLFIDDSARGSFWKPLVNTSFKEFKFEKDHVANPDETNIADECNHISIGFDSSNTYEIKTPSKLELTKVKSKYDDSLDDNYENLDARLKGTIIHRLMELIVTSKFALSKTNLIETIKSEYSISDDEYIKILNKVYDTMTSGGYEQANKREKDLFSILKKANCFCELPFSYKNGKDIWYGNIDLLYELDGKWYIVDYKTNFESSGLDKEYENQLKAYKDALKEIHNIDADAYIYHIG